jgi:hypothetical protein
MAEQIQIVNQKIRFMFGVTALCQRRWWGKKEPPAGAGGFVQGVVMRHY